jgi:hypothetical protein
LKRTCAAIVAALTKAKMTDVIGLDVPELLTGSVNGALPANYDPAKPCVDALPPTSHSHTFWPDGRFNSYDEIGQEVDNESYVMIDDHTFSMGDPTTTFHFSVTGNTIAFDVVVPAGCTSLDCHKGLAWGFAVAFPGQSWTRVTSGPHVP